MVTAAMDTIVTMTTAIDCDLSPVISSGAGRALSSEQRFAGPYARRVAVKTSIVGLGPKGLARATAHMRYLTAPDKSRGS